MMASSLLAKVREDVLSTSCRLTEVAVQPDACSTDPSALWTGEAPGWRCLRGGTFFASLPFLLGRFPPILRELLCSLVDEMVLILSVKYFLLPCGVFNPHLG